jgi:hypothetical protein
LNNGACPVFCKWMKKKTFPDCQATARKYDSHD